MCERKIPDYAIIKPGQELFRFGMTLKGRKIDANEEAKIRGQAERFKGQLRSKSDAEIAALFDDFQAKDWMSKHLALPEAAALIANKLNPDEHYSWEVERRKNCEADYLPHLKKIVLLGWVAFINPHTKKKFDHVHLSEVNFPDDGLLQVCDLHLCLMPADAGNSAFPVPPKAVSKAPAPISPVYPSTLTTTRSAPPPPEKRLQGTEGVTLKRRPVDSAVWQAKDLWEEEELICLLCGVDPSTRREKLPYFLSAKAEEAIQRAIAAGILEPILHQVESPGWFVAPSTVRYFKLDATIRWANSKRAEFPDFPTFSIDEPPSQGITTASNDTAANSGTVCSLAEEVANGEPVNWAKWNRMRSLRPDEAAKLVFCIDPIKWKGDRYAQGAIPQTLLDKIELCREYLSRIDDKWTFERLAEELPNELPMGMLDAIHPPEPQPAPPHQPQTVAPKTHMVTKDVLIAAFRCSADLFDNAHKFPWVVEARIAGKGGKKPKPAMYDPVAFANNLPSMTYGAGLTETRAWEILKRSFPLSYEGVSQFDPNDSK